MDRHTEGLILQHALCNGETNARWLQRHTGRTTNEVTVSQSKFWWQNCIVVDNQSRCAVCSTLCQKYLVATDVIF